MLLLMETTDISSARVIWVNINGVNLKLYETLATNTHDYTHEVYMRLRVADSYYAYYQPIFLCFKLYVFHNLRTSPI